MNPIIHHQMNYSQKNSCINYRENSVACLWAKSELTLFTTTTFFLCHGLPPNIKQLAFTHIKRLVNAFPCSLRLRMISEFPSYSQSVYLYTARLAGVFCGLVYTTGFEPIVLNLDVAIFKQFQPIKLSVPQSNPNLSAITPYAYCLFLYSVMIQLFIRIRWCHPPEKVLILGRQKLILIPSQVDVERKAGLITYILAVTCKSSMPNVHSSFSKLLASYY